MSFLRLSDDYVDHPKFQVLSDGAFRLWHYAMCFSRKFKTDGLVPASTLKGFKSYSPKRARELVTPHQTGEKALWQTVEGFGIRIHDYLFWNLSKDEEHDERTAATVRMRKFRDRRGDGVRDASRDGVRDGVGDAFVPVVVPDRGSGIVEKGSGGKPPHPARSGRPIFDGQRLTVFEWQLTELMKTLGPHTDSFDLHEWFFAADQLAMASGIVKKPREWWPWLVEITVAEAARRGLPTIGEAPGEAECNARFMAEVTRQNKAAGS